MVSLSHKLLSALVHIEAATGLETIYMWPDVEPSGGFATMEAQALSELQDLDLATYNTEPRQVLYSRPCENLGQWCHDALGRENWSCMDARHPENGEMFWRLTQVLMELHEPGTTHRLREQSKLDRYDHDFQTLFADRMTATFNGVSHCHFHPLEMIRRVTGAVRDIPEDIEDISPIRSSRTGSRAGSRLSSTPSNRRTPTAEEIRMRSAMDNMQVKINLLERVVSGMDINPRSSTTPLQVTFDDDEPEERLCGRHAALIKGIIKKKSADSDTSMLSQEPRGARKRTRENTSKYITSNNLPYLVQYTGSVRDGPNGTVDISSEDGEEGNLIIDLTEAGRQVTRDRPSATPDTSPELGERTRQLHEHDARRIIEMRRNLTSTRRFPTLPSPGTSRSPLRRPNTARDQSQRSRTDEMERDRIVRAVRDKNAGRQTEDTERLESTEILFTDRQMYEDFMAQARGEAEPGPTMRAVLTMVDDVQVREITIPRLDRAKQKEDTPRTPPPSYDEAVTADVKPADEQTQAENEEDTQAPDNNTTVCSSITLGSTITIDSDSDRTNNNSLDTSSKSGASVEVIAQMLHGAKQGSHFTAAAYKSICRQKAAENLAKYPERLREGQFEDLEMNPPEMPELEQDRSVAQSPLSRQQLQSSSYSEHSSMSSLTKTSTSELSDISDDDSGLVIKGHASSETFVTEEDEIVLHEDPTERAELEADLPKESGEIVDEINIQLKQYYTTPKGRGNKPQITSRYQCLFMTRPRHREGQGREGQGVRPEDPHVVYKKLWTGFFCMVKLDMEMEWINLCDSNELYFAHFL